MSTKKIMYGFPEQLDTRSGKFATDCGTIWHEMPKDDTIDTETETDYDYQHLQNYFIPVMKRCRMSEWNFTINCN